MTIKVEIQDQINQLGGYIAAAKAFNDTLWDKADYFAKLCEETTAKLYKAEEHYKELKDLLAQELHFVK